MKQQRLKLTGEEALIRSSLVCRNIMQMRQYRNAKTILCYHAFVNEVNLEQLIKNAWNVGKKVYLPVVTADNQLNACEYNKDSSLTKHSFGMSEPKIGMPVEPEKLDLIIVPGLAFDRRMHRIGFGAGYYDRYLMLAKNAFKIGASYAFQIVECIEEDKHDVALDAIASERDVLYRV